MNLLKKMIFGILITAGSVAFCNEEPSPDVENNYNYWAIGVGIPTVVSVKFGHRKQLNCCGFEYGIGLTPLIFVTEGHVFGSFLFYPNPNLSGQAYLGVGLRAGGFLKKFGRNNFGYVAPGIVVGRESESAEGGRRFTQVSVSPGALTTNSGVVYLPSISLAFGYGF